MKCIKLFKVEKKDLIIYIPIICNTSSDPIANVPSRMQKILQIGAHTGHLPSYCDNSPAGVGNFQLYRSPDKPQHKFTEDMCFVKPKTNTCLLL